MNMHAGLQAPRETWEKLWRTLRWSTSMVDKVTSIFTSFSSVDSDGFRRISEDNVDLFLKLGNPDFFSRPAAHRNSMCYSLAGASSMDCSMFLKLVALLEASSPHILQDPSAILRAALIHRCYDKGFKGFLNSKDYIHLLEDVTFANVEYAKHRNTKFGPLRLIEVFEKLGRFPESDADLKLDLETFSSCLDLKILSGFSQILRVNVDFLQESPSNYEAQDVPTNFHHEKKEVPKPQVYVKAVPSNLNPPRECGWSKTQIPSVQQPRASIPYWNGGVGYVYQNTPSQISRSKPKENPTTSLAASRYYVTARRPPPARPTETAEQKTPQRKKLPYNVTSPETAPQHQPLLDLPIHYFVPEEDETNVVVQSLTEDKPCEAYYTKSTSIPTEDPSITDTSESEVYLFRHQKAQPRPVDPIALEVPDLGSRINEMTPKSQNLGLENRIPTINRMLVPSVPNIQDNCRPNTPPNRIQPKPKEEELSPCITRSKEDNIIVIPRKEHDDMIDFFKGISNNETILRECDKRAFSEAVRVIQESSDALLEVESKEIEMSTRLLFLAKSNSSSSLENEKFAETCMMVIQAIKDDLSPNHWATACTIYSGETRHSPSQNDKDSAVKLANLHKEELWEYVKAFV
eukprot:GHVP01052950.1.p1 GENE.GHVP01052950.1~~GHVP01052950.1.p1  ORF type:complete len:632 (-),score=103.15 GHVP01052950.1:42-1937(-)